jgi:hypothetical protein
MISGTEIIKSGLTLAKAFITTFGEGKRVKNICEPLATLRQFPFLTKIRYNANSKKQIGIYGILTPLEAEECSRGIVYNSKLLCSIKRVMNICFSHPIRVECLEFIFNGIIAVSNSLTKTKNQRKVLHNFPCNKGIFSHQE